MCYISLSMLSALNHLGSFGSSNTSSATRSSSKSIAITQKSRFPSKSLPKNALMSPDTPFGAISLIFFLVSFIGLIKDNLSKKREYLYKTQELKLQSLQTLKYLLSKNHLHTLRLLSIPLKALLCSYINTKVNYALVMATLFSAKSSAMRFWSGTAFPYSTLMSETISRMLRTYRFSFARTRSASSSCRVSIRSTISCSRRIRLYRFAFARKQ